MNRHTLVLAGAMALAHPLPAAAQTGANDPSSARQAVPALRYDSAFTGYKPWRDGRPGDWRALNDALAKDGRPAGGHAGHGAAPPRPAAASAPSGPAASAGLPSGPTETGPHAHGGHGGMK